MELEFHQLDMRYEGLRVRRPERERRLLSSLAERGQQVPIVVIGLTEEANRFLVIDGYKRIRALRRLGQDTVRATVLGHGRNRSADIGPVAADRRRRNGARTRVVAG